MARISAASNLIIEVQPESWRLLSNGGDSERVLVEAVPGEPLRYVSSFGSKRRLPEVGLLEPDDIQRVVLGWSPKDEAWHLGLVLNGDLATQRGSRWCGLAYWFDPHAAQLQDAAVRAGQELAKQVSRPFTVIPPETDDDTPMVLPSPYSATAQAPQPAYETPREAIRQPALPLKFDLWTLRRLDPARVELVLSPAWGRARMLRAAWYIVWLGVFIILTVATLTSEIALPRPEFLVYLGFASIFVLLVAIFYNLYQAGTKPNRVIFEQGGIRWLRGKRVRRAIPAGGLQAVYVSHIISKVGKRNEGKDRSVRYGELNLLLRDGDFLSLLNQPSSDDKIPYSDDPLDEEAVMPLTEYNARTRLQAAGLVIANALGKPAYYDKRLR